MSLEQAIHQRWAACVPLDSLLPVERLTTGRRLSTPAPYATLLRDQTHTVCRTNGSRLDEVTLRLTVWHADYALGRAVVGQIESCFDGWTPELDDGQQVLALRRIEQTDRQHDDGLWQFDSQWLARVLVPVVVGDG